MLSQFHDRQHHRALAIFAGNVGLRREAISKRDISDQQRRTRGSHDRHVVERINRIGIELSPILYSVSPSLSVPVGKVKFWVAIAWLTSLSDKP